MRNPWANEKYTGPWSDSSRNWTEEYKRQVPYERSNEGHFFISLKDFKNAFYVMSIHYYKDDFQTSFYEKNGASSNSEVFNFELPRSQEAFISLDFYVNRMYPYGCDGSSSGTITLYKGSKKIKSA